MVTATIVVLLILALIVAGSWLGTRQGQGQEAEQGRFSTIGQAQNELRMEIGDELHPFDAEVDALETPLDLDPVPEVARNENPNLQEQLQAIQTSEIGMETDSFQLLQLQLKEAEIALGQINYSLQTLKVLTQVENGIQRIQINNQLESSIQK